MRQYNGTLEAMNYLYESLAGLKVTAALIHEMSPIRLNNTIVARMVKDLNNIYDEENNNT